MLSYKLDEFRELVTRFSRETTMKENHFNSAMALMAAGCLILFVIWDLPAGSGIAIVLIGGSMIIALRGVGEYIAEAINERS